jgi:pimeloyl-ACP methyl ester carboxylesterase
MPPEEVTGMATFGLVHGGFHGGWCWDRLILELEARGHDAVAMDMPIEDPDATVSDYVDAVVRALTPVDEPVILVGHSLGGLIIPHVARVRPVSRLVFLCAMVENLPGGSDEPDPVPMSHMDMSVLRFDGQLTAISPEGAREAFFGDCDPADVESALSRLKPQGAAIATPLVAPWPDVPSSMITTTDDRSHNPEYDRLVTGPRLGVEPIELPGDHSPFRSRPAALADVLADLARVS